MNFSTFVRKLEGKPLTPLKPVFPYPGAKAMWNGRSITLIHIMPEEPGDDRRYWEFYDDHELPLFTFSHPGVAWENDFIERKY